VRLATVTKPHDERRQYVVDLLKFIHDFNSLDTTLLIEKAHADFAFVEAAEAVLLTKTGAWNSVDALRDFCVHALTGEQPPTKALTDRIRPHQRVTPFSVPYELLRAVVPNRSSFDPSRLRTLSLADAITVAPQVESDLHQRVQLPQNEWWLVTTLWARALPHAPWFDKLNVRVVDMGSNRILHEGKLWALFEEPMPCFWSLGPSSMLEIGVRVWRDQKTLKEDTTLMFAIEGWRYQLV
jgi:hypothetical protein